jgi:hypothetical protein
MDSNKLPKIIEKKADDILAQAEQDDVVHGLLSLLPAGGFLDSVLFKRIKKNARERLEEFHIKFARELSRLNEEKVDNKVLDSPEFDALVMKVVAKTMGEHSEEKRAYLRAILLNSVTIDLSKNPLKETVVNLMDDLSPAHIKVLWAFSNGKIKTDSGFNNPSKLPMVIESLSESDGEAITHDLFKKGLLDRVEEDRDYIASALGKCLLKFLEEPFSDTN